MTSLLRSCVSWRRVVELARRWKDIVARVSWFHKPTDEKRMVVILEPEQFEDWLQAPATRSMEFLRPFPAERLRAG